ncbi:DUF1939 domain-containing protein [Mucilaginibacter corticis]|uniref:DUF1939 domain-containing protein n=1 Tax=Mucilaginibacter corticis TaxID=2597670 RepID=A0A556M867_9SPHI|nr:DUF1939 domain-containing protein [Mucilaginibacter corticis]
MNFNQAHGNGHRLAGKTLLDLLGNVAEEVALAENGWAEFKVMAASVSVWAAK